MTRLDDGGAGEFRILVVHADPAIGSALVQRLARVDRLVKLVGTGTEALEVLHDCDFRLLVLCAGLPDLDPLEILQEIRRHQIATSSLILASEPTEHAAAAAFHAGASDYLPWPCDDRRLLQVVQEILAENCRPTGADSTAKSPSEESGPPLICRSAGMRRAVKSLQEALRHSRPVLFTGEPGTGKSFLAQILHSRALREATAPLHTIPAGTLPLSQILAQIENTAGPPLAPVTGLLEASPAATSRSRLQGTLFLQHVDALAAQERARLLDSLTRYWGKSRSRNRTSPRLRLVMTWTSQPHNLSEQREWIEYLMHSLGASIIDVPPLRSRERDFALLIHHAIQTTAVPASPARTMTRQAIDRLWQRRWAGNVRELETLIQRLVAYSTAAEISLVDVADLLLDQIQDPAADPRCFPLEQTVVDLNRSLPDWRDDLIRRMDERYFQYMLTRSAGRIELCAQLSGLSRRSVSSKLRSLGIDKRVFKQSSRKAKRAAARRGMPLEEVRAGAV